MTIMQQPLAKARPARKGQSIVEFALSSILIVLLLAGAVDFGRAFYTYVVVLNMAGEAATILAFYPDNDINQDESNGRFTPDNATFQRRAEQVAARSLGLVINSNDTANISDADVRAVSLSGANMHWRWRRQGCPFNIQVSYRLNDLFFPALLGFRQLTIGGSSGSRFTADSNQLLHNSCLP